MEDQFTHQDEKGYGEQREGRNGGKSSCDDPNKPCDSSQEEIGRNHIDNEKGKGNGQVGEKQENHAPEEQTNDQPPFHGLLSHPDIDKPAPGHPEELDGKEDAAYGDDDENSRFRNSNCPYVRHPSCNTLTHMDHSQKDHGSAGKSADDKHDAIKSVLGLFIEMSVYDVRSDMPLLSQKPGRPKENNPQEGIFGYRHDPYRGLSK